MVSSVLARGGAAEDGRSWWNSYVARFVTAQGRVSDDGPGEASSHSEGQTSAMLLAVRARDEAVFDRIRAWTMRNLACRGDALLAWRYEPGKGVVDRNNATDADLFHALALVEADRLWPWKQLRQAACDVADSCLRHLLRESGGMVMLLPGAYGFEGRRHIDLNPSYINPRVFRALHDLTGNAAWATLAEDGLRLLDRARFGRWELPPDWVRLNRAGGSLAPSPIRVPRFGYDALRVARNLVWAGEAGHPAARAIHNFWRLHGAPPPAWVDLANGQQAPYRGDVGHMTVQNLLAHAQGDRQATELAGFDYPARFYGATLRALCGAIERERMLS